MLAELKSSFSSREKINAWIDNINERDQATRDEVLKLCADNLEARAFYVAKFEAIKSQPKLGALPEVDRKRAAAHDD